MSDTHANSYDSHGSSQRDSKHEDAPGVHWERSGQQVGATSAEVSPTILSDPAIMGRGNGPVRQAAVQRMQQTYGNRATRRFLQRSTEASQPATPLAIQRTYLDAGDPVAAWAANTNLGSYTSYLSSPAQRAVIREIQAALGKFKRATTPRGRGEALKMIKKQIATWKTTYLPGGSWNGAVDTLEAEVNGYKEAPAQEAEEQHPPQDLPSQTTAPEEQVEPEETSSEELTLQAPSSGEPGQEGASEHDEDGSEEVAASSDNDTPEEDFEEEAPANTNAPAEEGFTAVTRKPRVRRGPAVHSAEDTARAVVQEAISKFKTTYRYAGPSVRVSDHGSLEHLNPREVRNAIRRELEDMKPSSVIEQAPGSRWFEVAGAAHKGHNFNIKVMKRAPGEKNDKKAEAQIHVLWM